MSLLLADALRSKGPFLLCLKILGFLPWRLANDERFKESSILSKSHSALTTCLYLSMLMAETCLTAANFINRPHYFILTLGTNVFRVLSMVEILLMLLFGERAIMEICEAYKEYDVTARELGYPRRDDILSWWFLSLILFSLQLFGHFRATRHTPCIFYGYSTFRAIVDTILKLYLYGLFNLLQQRVRHFNDVIIVRSARIADKARFIKVPYVRRMHRFLLKCGENLNELCRRYLFYTLAEFLLYSIIQAHTFYNELFRLSLDAIVFVGIGPAVLTIVVSVCDGTAKEINRTSSRVPRNIAINIDSNAADAVRFVVETAELILYFLHHKFHFSALRWFSVDLALVKSVASFVTTYLVLLVENERHG